MRFIALLMLSGCVAFGQAFTFSDIPFLAQQGTDWQKRVVANGGTMPSANTITCMERLRQSLVAQGITNKIYSMCVFVPDSVIASATPLFYHLGYPMWTNNFVIGDLNISGLKGDGSTKAMDTGVRVVDYYPLDESCGISTLVTESSSNDLSTVVAYRSLTSADPIIELDASIVGITRFFSVQNVLIGNSIQTNDFARVGWVSGNRNDSDAIFMFVASPLEAHKLLQTKTGVIDGGITDTDTLPVFAARMGVANTNIAGSFSAQRLSFVALHDGLTQTESSNFWWAVKTCRECLGGGTGDNIHDYNRKVVAFGGAAISTTTSNALRTCYTGLDTDGTLYSMVAVNAMLPDNLVAARTPFIWQAGSQIWGNVNFVDGDLTTGGLTGNLTTKHLTTGIIPATAVNRGFSTTSAGYAAIVSTNNTAGRYLINDQNGGDAATSHFGMSVSKGGAFYFCWRASGVNADFLHAPTTGITNAFYSGQRTAANAIALYAANTATAHFSITNGTGAQAGSAIPTQACFGYAANNGSGTPGAWCDHTVSFMALTSGLTQTQSSNLWIRARDLRSTIGAAGP